jgi:GntR family transcriptional regulator
MESANIELGKAEEIAEKIRVQITNGALPVGTKVASERDLSEELGVSRMTVRRAIQLLEGEGLVVRYPVRGTFVAGAKKILFIKNGREVLLHDRSSSVEIVAEGKRLEGPEPSIQFIERPALVVADAEIAKHLQIEEGTLVLRHYQVQTSGNAFYALIETYYPSDLFGELLTRDIGHKPLYVWLRERHGLIVTHFQEIVTARLAVQSERQQLHVSSNTPVIVIDRTAWIKEVRPIEWSHITTVAALTMFAYEYDIAEWNQAQLERDNVEIGPSNNL